MPIINMKERHSFKIGQRLANTLIDLESLEAKDLSAALKSAHLTIAGCSHLRHSQVEELTTIISLIEKFFVDQYIQKGY